jgi:hypothetical protein
MKTSVFGWRPLQVVAGLVFIAAWPLANVWAQAPPGPLPQTASQDRSAPAAQITAPRPDVTRTKILAGTWRLNLDESDDPAKKPQQARGSDNNGQYGGHRGGGMGGGWPGGGGIGGRGGMGGGGRGGQSGGGESDSDRQKMHLFLEPAQQLTITQKEPEINVADDSDRKFAFYTDNRKVEKSKDPSHQELTAKWDGYRLVAEGKDPRGNKYERSYEVLDGNQQLRETLLLKVGRSSTEVSIRYVYDLVSPPPKTQPQPVH